MQKNSDSNCFSSTV